MISGKILLRSIYIEENLSWLLFFLVSTLGIALRALDVCVHFFFFFRKNTSTIKYINHDLLYKGEKVKALSDEVICFWWGFRGRGIWSCPYCTSTLKCGESTWEKDNDSPTHP